MHCGGERSVHLAKAEGRAGADKELVIIEEIVISKWGTLMCTSGQQEPCLEAKIPSFRSPGCSQASSLECFYLKR